MVGLCDHRRRDRSLRVARQSGGGADDRDEPLLACDSLDRVADIDWRMHLGAVEEDGIRLGAGRGVSRRCFSSVETRIGRAKPAASLPADQAEASNVEEVGFTESR